GVLGACVVVGVAHLFSWLLTLRTGHIDAACNRVGGWPCPGCGTKFGESVVYIGREPEFRLDGGPFSFLVGAHCDGCDGYGILDRDQRAIRSDTPDAPNKLRPL